ncbi:hypothetical protein P879_07709 [Paragonimus westermani]|uniref:SKI/SNO/DAC domain-containing protein n=1 Tax=Paragonimus westermani TaxID=34504 RepID=A0A8T0D740_9TREM|nr:hypothetical protein P879_07709 [Paragonimus westermani]
MSAQLSTERNEVVKFCTQTAQETVDGTTLLNLANNIRVPLTEATKTAYEAFQAEAKRSLVVDLSTKGTCGHDQLNPPYTVGPPLRAHLSKPLAYCTPNPVPNLPENNQVHLLEYRGAQLAAFTVESRELICLPQAFELFLKHLVGGLHTVYTKLKRLEIIPVVCNVEQVRILRGLGAIQPGVNRCKLIAPQEFDVLYADCTNSRQVVTH